MCADLRVGGAGGRRALPCRTRHIHHGTFSRAGSGGAGKRRHLMESAAGREARQRLAAMLKQALDARRLPVMPGESHIVPVMVGDPVTCKRMSDLLPDDYAIHVQPINCPTVPRGTERLRFTPGPLHTEADLRYLVDSPAEVWSRLGCDRIARRPAPVSGSRRAAAQAPHL